MFKYGMRLRGFSLGCQPMNGFVSREDDPSGKYHDILCYDRQLSPDELEAYELDDLGCTCIHVSVDHSDWEKIEKLYLAKKALVEKATGASTSLTGAAGVVTWTFSPQLSPELTQAVLVLLTAMCKHARLQKRITVKPREVENERYAMRTFLLRIGLIGPEHKETRRLLLQNLSGDAAFAHGRPPRK